MSRTAGSKPILLAFVLLACTTQVVGDTYCPLSLIGQFNGVYYYYGQSTAGTDCSKNPLTGVSDSRVHQIGNTCSDCLDPVRVDGKEQSNAEPPRPKPAPEVAAAIVDCGVASSAAPKDASITFAPAPKQKGIKNYVRKRKSGGKPGEGHKVAGESEDDAVLGDFCRPGGHVTIDADDIAVIILAGKPKRYFRILTVKVTTSSNVLYVRIGQELNPHDPGTATANEFEFSNPDEVHLHYTLNAKGDDKAPKFYVLAKSKL